MKFILVKILLQVKNNVLLAKRKKIKRKQNNQFLIIMGCCKLHFVRVAEKFFWKKKAEKLALCIAILS